jgi:diaminohydroxyphosphoribosylaminopyrimidine deaminase/5-amino-6-(5-phosphoribosylamino)uracil reductase
MTGNTDYKFMSRCLELASRAEGLTYPNPLVGCVIVHNGLIIGEGYHKKAGEDHAEVIAINSVSDKSLLSKSTLYVSLEPCSHTGKTPPCSDLIIAKGIPEVVAGTVDTSKKISGKGISKLKASGCKVTTGVLEEECRRINRRFFTFHEKRRPYITLKWAQSSDGFIDKNRNADSDRHPNWITGKAEQVLVHKWRSEEEAILVGAGTIRTDKPELNVRYWEGRNPLKIILTRSGDLKKYLQESETKGTVIAYTGKIDEDFGEARGIKLNKDIPSSVQVVDYLYNTDIQSLFIEGGAEVISHFIENDLWDEARVFTGKDQFISGISSPLVAGELLYEEDFEVSRLRVFLNK